MRVKVNGAKIYYKETKANEGAMPVIFVHGFPFSHKMWQPQLEVLPEQFRGIAYDLRGHGYSEVGDGQYSIELLADDLLAFMDVLKIEKAVVCGLSMGGYVLLRALEKAPEKFAGIILCDTRAETDTDEGRLKRVANIKKIKTEGVEAFADDLLKGLFWEETFTKNPGIVKSIRNLIEDTSPLSLAGSLLAMAARTDTSCKLDEVKIPALIFVGEHDKLTPPIAAQSMHEKIAHSQIEIIPDAAHMSSLENPQVFNEKMLAFLDKVNTK